MKAVHRHRGMEHKVVFPSWPQFEPDEIEAAVAVLRSGKVNYWTGAQGRLFEGEFAASVGSKYAVCVANGTVALELSLCALGIRPGDEVITSPRTFIGSASSIAMRGARPVFADIDSESQNIRAESIEPLISSKTKAIIVVHLAGWPCDMDPILALAKQHNLRVIEDCAQAQGASYKGRPVGSMGDAAAFSFCQDKIMTTGGEGGMLVTNNREVWSRACSYKDHGKNYEIVHNRKNGIEFSWPHESIGTNWRMTEMQAAIGRVALAKVPEWVEKRRQHASALTAQFCGFSGIRVPVPSVDYRHSFYKFYAFIEPDVLGDSWTRGKIIQEILDRGVPCSLGSCGEIYREKAFSNGRIHERLPNAKALGETSLMFLVHPTLKDEHIETTCEVVKQVMAKATSKPGAISKFRQHTLRTVQAPSAQTTRL
jgi:dTDP-4-amino-4,6-dideoxygalactose transaminase